MYTQPPSLKNLVTEMATFTESLPTARTLVQVELVLYMAEQLGLDSEPITVGWVLLSRMPVRHELLERLSAEQRRMLANAAVMVPRSSRFAWESDLIDYARNVPEYLKLFRIDPNVRLDEQYINLVRRMPNPDPIREQKYAEVLQAELPFEQRTRRPVKVGETYQVRVPVVEGGMRSGSVEITQEMQPPRIEPTWFEAPRSRTVIAVSLEELLPTAEYLDQRESELGIRPHWVHDLKQIRYRRALISDDKITLENENAYPLHLEGAFHLPGMVSAGKTTLAKLLIAHCIRMALDVRVTLVVGDTQSAIQIAHQVNSWFYDDPADDQVIAVPLLGNSQREKHLGRLLASHEYTKCRQEGRAHWGERWLMPVCPLASQIHWDGQESVSIPAGLEPCQGLTSEPRKGRGKRERHLCPLFHTCPSKQVFRDMPGAQVWVTTPGALSQASIPLHLEDRVITMGDLVYEQSDLVILDEVETIVDWFDRAYAVREELTNGKDGLLDRLDAEIAIYWSTNRVLPADFRRWIIAARESIKALSAVLTTIADVSQQRTVREWVKRGYFTPNQLAFRLARRLAGLKESDGADVTANQRAINDELARNAFQPFNILLNQTTDPLRYRVPQKATNDHNAAYGLAIMMQSINNLTDEVADPDILLQIRAWLSDWHTNLKEKLVNLATNLAKSDNPWDGTYLEKQADRDVEEVVQRLHFVLTVALLDRHIRIVIQDWYNKPDTIDAPQPFSRIPRGMQHILPLPLTGQQYGFANDRGDGTGGHEVSNRLSMFAYTNIGRSYLLNYTQLRTPYDGMPGPHVLALSGTSYLPDSTAFHYPIEPSGLLIAPEQTERAIKASRFALQVFYDTKGKPITVSGHPDKVQQLRILMEAMLRYGGVEGGYFGKILGWIDEQAQRSPQEWADRSRLLLLTNSYAQSAACARILRDKWRTQANTIFDLKRGSEGEDFEVVTEDRGTLLRMDIERFAATSGRILIAPMQSIGRGFNILNEDGKAAFGAVFFLTRPMDQPHDLTAMAQELNRYAIQWASDPTFAAWAEDTLYQRALNARNSALELRRSIEQRRGYGELRDKPELRMHPRRDLAASTAGRIVQAVGRLLRGSVPFRAYFVDAAWSPVLAKSGDPKQSEPEETSLLTAMINVLSDYAEQNEFGQQLYGALCEALITTENRDSN